MNSIVITGGHHSSALPVIKEIKERYPQIKIYWYGHKHSLKGSKSETLEYKEINKLGVPFYNLHAGKFYKTFNLVRLAKIPYGFFQSLHLLKKHKPDIILSFGGYLGVPVVLAGWFLKIPSVTHEQTVVIGYANKFISKFARKILYTWDQSLKFIPKDKAVKTGLPLRKEIKKPNNEEFKSNNDLPTIYVTAGKTGSHDINIAILNNLEEILSVTNIIHQTGDHTEFRDFEKLKHRYSQIKDKVDGEYYIRKFIYSEDIGDAFNEADLVISRSGAHTILELMTLNKPCILVPIPWSSHNEQYKNAKIVEDSGLGIVLEQKYLDEEGYLIKMISKMTANLDSFKCKKVSVDTDNAAKLIVDEVEKVVKKKN